MRFLWTDFSHAVRGLRKSPALAAIAIASLALGIAANVTVFSVVREMILDDLGAWRPDRLAGVEAMDVSYTLYRQIRAAGAFEDLALLSRLWRPGLARPASTLKSHGEMTTSPNFFDVLGVRPSAGRLYSQADEGREFAVVSHGFFRNRMHGDLHNLGQPIQLNGKLYAHIGLLPADYRSIYGNGVSPEIYITDPGNADPHDHIYGLFGRLR